MSWTMPSTGARTTRLRRVAAWRRRASLSWSRSALAAASSASTLERCSRSSTLIAGSSASASAASAASRRGPRLLDVAGEIAQLPLDRDHAQPRIQALLGQAADRVELLLEQAVAGAQAVDLGAAPTASSFSRCSVVCASASMRLLVRLARG